jgi:hypothetical protein
MAREGSRRVFVRTWPGGVSAREVGGRGFRGGFEVEDSKRPFGQGFAMEVVAVPSFRTRPCSRQKSA